MDITPHTNLLKSLRGERQDYVLLIGEGVDNAFDAGASTVTIRFDNDEVSFEDDGDGITREHLPKLFSLGEHGPMSTTQLGRFGIGIKSQAVNAGDVLLVNSVSKDGKVRAFADWPDIVENGRWRIDDPRWLLVEVGTPTGSKITIARLRFPPQRIHADKIAHEVALRFHPALVEGRRIIMNGRFITPIDEPTLTDVVTATLNLSGGRSAMVRAGILTAPSKLNRVHVAYRHRVIMPESGVGCKMYGGLTKLFARVKLSGPWRLAKFKNDLPDEDEREELEDAVFAVLRPLLEKVTSASMDARVHQMSQLVNDRVPVEMQARAKAQNKVDRQKRGKSSPGGHVDPDKSTPGGPAKSKRHPPNLLLITFDGEDENDGVGVFAPGRPHRVNLSKDNPFVRRLVHAKDAELGADTLLMIALALFERGVEEHSLQRELELAGSFGKRLSILLAKQRQDQPEKTA